MQTSNTRHGGMPAETTPWFLSGRRIARIAATGLLLVTLGISNVIASGASPAALVILPIKLLDTSGEPTDQTLQHADRLVRLGNSLAADLSRSGLYRATVLTSDDLRQACPSEEIPCLLQAVRTRGGERIFIGVVHKSSTLIMQLWARVVDAHTGREIFSRDLNFRGDTDEAWQRAEAFLFSQIDSAKAEGR